jgi:hypothetical protein
MCFFVGKYAKQSFWVFWSKFLKSFKAQKLKNFVLHIFQQKITHILIDLDEKNTNIGLSKKSLVKFFLVKNVKTILTVFLAEFYQKYESKFKKVIPTVC